MLAPDGRELFFTRIVDGEYVMHCTRLLEGAWTAPEPVRPWGPGRRALGVDMSYSADGRRLYFLGAAPAEPFPDADPPLDLWWSEREAPACAAGAPAEWSIPTLLAAPLSTDAAEIYPCVVADGSLYFTSDRPGGRGKNDVWRAQRLADGDFAAPVNLGPEINTEHSGDMWVSPDERVLVVSFGSAINTTEVEYCPMGTWDGRWLSFSRRDGPWETATTGDVFWIDAAVLARFRP